MKKYFLILTLLLCQFAYSENLYNWKVNKVVDGDTVEVEVNFLPQELGNKLKVRVYGVDTPEKGWRAKSIKEALMGSNATKFTTDLLKNAKEVKIKVVSWDKFGGRILGDIIVDGKSLRQLLLKNGYAREYYGDKKESW